MSRTSTTELKPAMAPSLMNGRSHAIPGPAALTATAMGSGTARFVYFIMPVSTPVMRIKMIVQMASEPRIPIGMSR